MEFYFAFKRDMIEIHKSGILLKNNISASLNDIRGLAWGNYEILINLNANVLKDYNEGEVINLISNTIIHEYIHTILYNMLDKTKHNKSKEETICMLMANQLPLGSRSSPT